MSSARKLSEIDRLNEVVTDEKIAARAFQLWLERGCPQNDADTDWHNAYFQLTSESTLRNAMATASNHAGPMPPSPVLVNAASPSPASLSTALVNPAQGKPVTKRSDKPSPPSSRRRLTFPKGHSPVY
jgi:hypothetical protein